MSGERFLLSGVAIDNLDFRESLAEMGRRMAAGGRSLLVTPNAAHVVLFQRDEEFRAAYASAALVLPDSIPILWASRLLGRPLKERCAGSDLFSQSIAVAAAAGRAVFILGGRFGSEMIALRRLRREYPGLRIDSYSPPFGFELDPGESSRIVEAVNAFGTDLLIVCVGTPKSEKWLHGHLGRLNVGLACSFGMALDVYAGRIRRAPLVLRQAGLEWLWRLIRDPLRLAKRYVIGNSLFIGLVLRQWVFGRGLAGRRPK